GSGGLAWRGGGVGGGGEAAKLAAAIDRNRGQVLEGLLLIEQIDLRELAVELDRSIQRPAERTAVRGARDLERIAGADQPLLGIRERHRCSEKVVARDASAPIQILDLAKMRGEAFD